MARFIPGTVLYLAAAALGAFLGSCDLTGEAVGEPCEQAWDCAGDEFCNDGTCARRSGLISTGADAWTGHDAHFTPDEIESWERWGTAGSRSDEGVSPEGYGYCSTAHVRTDDLSNLYVDDVPMADWSSGPIQAAANRCGDDLETLSWRLMNCERITRGLDPVTCDLRLVWLGRKHSSDMERDDFFDHVNNDGLDPFDRLSVMGIDYQMAGENLARFPTVERAHLAWMDSEDHRRNILTPNFTFGGVGAIRSERYILLSQELTLDAED